MRPYQFQNPQVASMRIRSGGVGLAKGVAPDRVSDGGFSVWSLGLKVQALGFMVSGNLWGRIASSGTLYFKAWS